MHQRIHWPTAAADHHVFGRPIGLFIIVLYKAIWGAAELASGVAVFFSFHIIARELAEDPQDLLINWLLSHMPFNAAGMQRLGVFLTVLGISKLLLAFGLWHRSWAIRNALLVFFAAALIFAVYHLSLQFTSFKALAVLADAVVIFYLWKILPKHLSDIPAKS